MKIYLSLFWLFAQIGTFTLGGGYAMLPLMQRALVEKKKYLTEQDFLDTAALAQTAPGIMAVNMAVLTGKKLGGFWGSFFAALGASLPSFIIILLVAVFFRAYQHNPLVIRIFKGVRPAVVALIAVPVFRLARAAHIHWKTVWIPITVALLVWLVKVSPVYIVLAAGIGGYWYALRREAK